MKDKEFLEFLTSAEVPPSSLNEMTRKDVLLSFQGNSILKKFIAFQILGALISLSFCPQFGMSFFVDGHGFTHHLRMIGDWACAVFCGSLFLSSGSMLAIFFMKIEEFWWVWNHKKFSLILMPALFWGVLMSLNLSLKLPEETLAYHLSWLVAAIGIQLLVFKGRSLLFASHKNV